MARQKVLICGATGFIGRNFTHYYAQNKDIAVTAVYHKRPPFDAGGNVTWVKADLRNPDDVDRVVAGHDIIIQAAATTSGAQDIVNTPFLHVTDNAVMNSYLLRAAYAAGIKHFIFFSCSVMYPSSETPVTEDHFTGDISDKYFGVGWTKVYIERMCAFYAGLGRTKHTVIRHSNIYGPYDKFDFKRSHVFGATVSKTMLAEKSVTIWGTGEEKRDLLHVDDLTDFVARVIEHQKDAFGLYNCGSGTALSVKDLVHMIIAQSGKTLTTEHDLDKPSIAFNLALDCSKAQQTLGWRPRIALEDGIARTLQWWRENIDPETLLSKD